MASLSDFLRDEIKRSVLLLAVSAASLVLSILNVFPGSPVDPAWVAIILCGVPILWDAATGLILRHDIKADVLVSIALIAAVFLHEYFAAGEVAFIMALGGFLEDYSSAKANKGIETLVDMTPKTGRVVVDGTERIVPVEEVTVGQTLRVLPGESVPVDGRIVAGETSIDQSVMTGESIPVDKLPGDEVYSGTINQMGAFDMVATRTGEDSSIQRMSRMVTSVDAEKTHMVTTADRWATYLVAIVMVLAVLTYAVTRDIYRAVTVLIVFCPCAFILAAPTAIVAAVGNLTKRGVLVKDGDALERMASVDTVAFDKTGTITEGTPRVVDIDTVGDFDEFVAMAASAESRSEHPIGKAIVSYLRDMGAEPADPADFRMTVARGVSAKVDGREVDVGSPRLMSEIGVDIPEGYVEKAGRMYDEGCTTVFAAIDRRFAGMVTMSDSMRGDSARTVSELDELGVRCVLLTGDNPRSAGFMASNAGIKDYMSECTPEGKMEAVGTMQSQGSKVCMVGDGVNDALALKRSWVGVAMGDVGSDIAVDAADMAIVGGGIGALPHIVSLSRKMMTKLRVNIGFSLVWNTMAVLLAMFAVVGPVEGAIVHNVGSVAVVVNSALLLVYGNRVTRRDGTRSRPDRR